MADARKDAEPYGIENTFLIKSIYRYVRTNR